MTKQISIGNWVYRSLSHLEGQFKISILMWHLSESEVSIFQVGFGQIEIVRLAQDGVEEWDGYEIANMTNDYDTRDTRLRMEREHIFVMINETLFKARSFTLSSALSKSAPKERFKISSINSEE